ncbi:MAG: hypothetical protein ABDI19_03830 [Armatimonadota bacterium]
MKWVYTDWQSKRRDVVGKTRTLRTRLRSVGVPADDSISNGD